MKSLSKTLSSFIAVLLIAFACQASANLVTNGGFESGDFTGWTQGGNTGSTFVSGGDPNSGTFAADLGPSKSPGSLSQGLTTVAGAFYDLSFFMFADGGGKGPFGGGVIFFQVFWNGVMIFDTTNPPSSYQQFAFSVQATGSSTELRFVFQNDPAFFHLDDVSVLLAQGTGVPETFSTLWLVLPLIGMIGFSRFRRKELIRVRS
jgi:hypothetical protein